VKTVQKRKKFIEDNRSLNKVWLQFGGKRDEHDATPIETAIREVHKESLGVFKSEPDRWRINRIKNPGEWKILWKEEGRYALFLVEIPYDTKLPEKFLEAKKLLTNPTDQLCVKWFDFEKIDRAAERKTCFIYDDKQELELYAFYMQLMDHPDLAPYLSKSHR